MTAASSVFLAVQTLLNSANPDQGRQSALLAALEIAADELDAQEIARPPSAGTEQRSDRANVLAAAQASEAAGEPGTYVGRHDALVYTPSQALVTLHRYLVALGWKTTSAASTTEFPDPVPNASGRAGLLFYPDISRYQDGIDLGPIKAAGYAALVAKIGQGAGRTDGGTEYGQTLDPTWPRVSQQGLALWGSLFAGYWYVGNIESPTSQAQRCADALGDNADLPIMLDWEDGSGTWANLLAVLAAFQAAGLRVTMLYTFPTYASSHGGANMDAAGLSLVSRRYYNDAFEPPIAAYNATPTNSWNAFNGGTPRALQFTRKGTPVGTWTQGVDVNAFRGNMTGLLAMFQGANQVVAPQVLTPGDRPPIYAPATWRASLDKGLSNAHKPYVSAHRFPTTMPPPPVVDARAWRLPGGRQGYALAAYLPGGASRTMVEPNVPNFAEGIETWFGFSFMLSRNFPVTENYWHILAEWRPNTDSPPLLLQVRNGQLRLSGGAGHPDLALRREWVIDLAEVKTSTWYDLQARVLFSRFATVGSVDVHLDGVPRLEGYKPRTGTLYPSAAGATTSASSYLRYGLYRDPVCKREATVWHMGWAIGPTQGSVLLPGAG
jgi:hypothetical protein